MLRISLEEKRVYKYRFKIRQNIHNELKQLLYKKKIEFRNKITKNN